MKKFLFAVIFFFFAVNTGFSAESKSEFPFVEALKTCETYSQTGSSIYEYETYGIQINLEKSKNKCVYKEKIFQDKNYRLLTCNFDMALLPVLAASMANYNNAFKKEIAKNKIFEAKMTTNGEIFQNYLINPKYCQVSDSSSKNK